MSFGVSATAGGNTSDGPSASLRTILPSGPDACFHESRAGWIVLAAVWVASAAYLAWRLKTGWFPLDAGMLAQTAERVLRGQTPHIGFVDEYTGGLTYLNALALRLFGVNLLSVRKMMFLFFLAWVPSVYLVGRRFMGPTGAAICTFLAVVWGPSSYPEGMPSLYNLFFATWGLLALIRYSEGGRKRWLWVAGLMAGLSFLIKITALYFVAAALLFFLYRELSLARIQSDPLRRGGTFYRVFASSGLLLFLSGLGVLVAERPTEGNFAQFVFPAGCLVGFLLVATWGWPSGKAALRFRRLGAMCLPFVAAAAVPVGVFVLWYASKGGVTAWYRDTFTRGALHVVWTGGDARPLPVMIGLVPSVLVAALACLRPARWRVRVAALAMLAVLLAGCRESALTYLFVGYSLPFTVTLIAPVALVVFSRRCDGVQGQRIFLTVSAAIMWALVQFPTSGGGYWDWAMPLVVLALVGLSAGFPRCDKVLIGSIVAFYLVFALWLGTPGYLESMFARPHEHLHFEAIPLARAGGLRVRSGEAQEYGKLIAVVRAHANGPYIYCTPDCPEVYFLGGFRNPTGTIHDFLDPDFFNPAGRTTRIMTALADHGVGVAVVEDHGPRPSVSGTITPGLRAALDSRFPFEHMVGRFEVRWGPPRVGTERMP